MLNSLCNIKTPREPLCRLISIKKNSYTWNTLGSLKCVACIHDHLVVLFQLRSGHTLLQAYEAVHSQATVKPADEMDKKSITSATTIPFLDVCDKRKHVGI